MDDFSVSPCLSVVLHLQSSSPDCSHTECVLVATYHLGGRQLAGGGLTTGVSLGASACLHERACVPSLHCHSSFCKTYTDGSQITELALRVFAKAKARAESPCGVHPRRAAWTACFQVTSYEEIIRCADQRLQSSRSQIAL